MTTAAPQLAAFLRQAQALLRAGDVERADAVLRDALECHPDAVPAWIERADLATRARSFRAGVHHAIAAAHALARSGHWELLPHVALRLLSVGEYRLMAELVRRSPRSAPAVRRHAAGLVQYLGLAERHDDALALADEALLDAPADAALVYARAMVLRHLGRADEATEAYERCISIAPRMVEAHWSLAYHAASASPRARIPRLQRLLDSLPEHSPQAAMLHYALYRELENAGDVTEAWRELVAGAHARRRQVAYDADAEKNRFDALMALCDRDFAARADGHDDGHVPVFIVGLPRSGTTLLERVLGGHPQVRSAGELGDFHMQLCWQSGRVVREVADSELIAAAERMDFGALGRGYLQRTAWRLEGRSHLIDKFPANVAYAGLIARALPRARIICLRRNPMDSCLSGFKELFAGAAYPHSYDLHEMAGHYVRFRTLVDHWQQVMPERFLVVDYERLVSEPDVAAREVFAHCGLEFDRDCLAIERNRSAVATASSSQVREPIHVRHVGAWRRYAAQLEPVRAWLESALGEAVPR